MIPLFSAQQVRDADNYAINNLGIPGIVLMENASLNVFNSIIKKYGEVYHLNTVGVLAGKGNNGGDGFAIARHFINYGSDVIVIALGEEEELRGDALTNYRILKNLIQSREKSKIITYTQEKDLTAISNCSLIIDAMLGTGTRGELSDPYKSIVEFVNDLGSIKVAVDLPTGLDLNNAVGSTIFKADLTITLAELKTGLFYGDGIGNVGEVEKGSIGMGQGYFESLEVTDFLIEPEDAFVGLPEKSIDDYKYSAGKVLVIAGSGSYTGAGVLSAESVLKAGAGACFLAVPGSIQQLMQHKLKEVITLKYEDENTGYLRTENIDEISEKIDWTDVIAIGPGLGREETTLEAVNEVLSTGKDKKFVIDADALYGLHNGKYKQLKSKSKVFTPHHKEFSDLLEISLPELKNDLLKFGKDFAVETKSFLVLKGAPTIIFNPSGEAFINTTGNPGMAKFGTGDVLTGVIAGFLAQSDSIEDAVIAAVYLHSLSADLLMYEMTEYGFTATEIMENLPYAIKFIRDTFIQDI